MTVDRRDLDDLLVVVEDFATKVVRGSDEVDLARAAASPLPGLVTDLLEGEVTGSLVWAFEVVETVSRHSASWGFVLASRYAAQFATAGTPDRHPDCFLACAERTDNGLRAAAVPLAAGPLAGLLALTDRGVVLVNGAREAAVQPRRTGLTGARLTAAEAIEVMAIPGAGVHEWQVLLGGVLCGVGSAMTDLSVAYTREREQFGAPISSFPGLRAVVGEAAAGVRRARALLHAQASGSGDGLLADDLAVAGDVVVSTGIDTVQALGGYGYIDEYPAAGLARDAISLRARASSALTGWRSSASLAYAGRGR